MAPDTAQTAATPRIALPEIVLVAAAAENDVIGVDGGLPWRLPDDLRHFKRLTIGHAVVMGRATYQEQCRPLPDRTNIVLTTNPDWTAEGVHAVQCLRHAIEFALETHPGQPVMIIGGGRVYRQALPIASRIELTRVHARPDGDTTFPTLDASWILTRQEDRDADDRHAHAISFRTYLRAPRRPASR